MNLGILISRVERKDILFSKIEVYSLHDYSMSMQWLMKSILSILILQTKYLLEKLHTQRIVDENTHKTSSHKK